MYTYTYFKSIPQVISANKTDFLLTLNPDSQMIVNLKLL